MTTFLVVDDHAGFREEARRLLEGAGLDVLGEAADGRTAIDAAIELRPDAILLDIGLPDISGFEVVRALRERGLVTRILLASTRDATAYGDLIEASGAVGFVQKDDLTADLVLDLVA